MSITSLNLSLCGKCTANCVYCPQERSEKETTYMMRTLVEPLLLDVTAETFPWKIKTVQVGENGDALLNPHFLDILRLIRKYLPNVKINLTTNMLLLNRAKAIVLLQEKLITSLHLNIDGHDAITYSAQKRIPYTKVVKNLKDFITLRTVLQPKFALAISVLTLADYSTAVMKQYGKRPLKSPKGFPKSTYPQVCASLSWLPPDVYVRRSPIFTWAERAMAPNVPKGMACPQLPRVETEAFISPSGLWYPCCLDANQDQAYGNVKHSSLMELHESKQRKNFIARLKARQFAKIGYPCSKVFSCGIRS